MCIRDSVLAESRNKKSNVGTISYMPVSYTHLDVYKRQGNNRKSMAYVGNIVAFIRFLIENKKDGYDAYNYIDKPDFTMNERVGHVSKVLDKHIPMTHFPYWLGMLGGYGFDILAFVTRKKLTVSSVRVKKFCATTEFDASKALATGFKAPYTLVEGLARTLEFEFVHPRTDEVTFKSRCV